jgi:hypothetical protein
VIKGNIKAYSPAVNAGVIKGADGNLYQFCKTQWQGSETPKSGTIVSFIPQINKALQVSEATV